jgi:hypothetical protein
VPAFCCLLPFRCILRRPIMHTSSLQSVTQLSSRAALASQTLYS